MGMLQQLNPDCILEPLRESLENIVAQAPDPTQINQSRLDQAWALIFL